MRKIQVSQIYNSKYYMEPDQALERALNHIRAAIG
jgi:spore coat protein CotF